MKLLLRDRPDPRPIPKLPTRATVKNIPPYTIIKDSPHKASFISSMGLKIGQTINISSDGKNWYQDKEDYLYHITWLEFID
jgi:hypothetical protein